MAWSGGSGLPCHGSNVDDSPVVALHHARECSLNAQVSPGQIGVKNLLPIASLHPKHQPVPGDTGIIDQNVDFREFFLRLCESGLDGIRIRKVQ